MKLKEYPGSPFHAEKDTSLERRIKALFLYCPIRKNLSIINYEKVSRGLFKAILSLTAEKFLVEKLVKSLELR